jgi:hypothetical protein
MLLDTYKSLAAFRTSLPSPLARSLPVLQLTHLVPNRLSVAMIAPVITLLDIPALSMRWYRLGTRDGPPLDDPVASVAMSVISLGGSGPRGLSPQRCN